MKIVLTVSIVIAAVIHLLPITGVVSSSALGTLYGLSFEESNIQILMRHRAVLFGILGGVLLYAAFSPRFRLVAIFAGLISASSFLWIAFSVGGYNVMLKRVVQADLVALVCLILAAGVSIATRGGRPQEANFEHSACSAAAITSKAETASGLDGGTVHASNP